MSPGASLYLPFTLEQSHILSATPKSLSAKVWSQMIFRITALFYIL